MDKDMKNFIESAMQSFVNNYADMNLCKSDWDTPLIAYAAADDPLFAKLKELVSPNHSMPSDFLAEAKTVIAYFIPYARDISLTNLNGIFPSEEWSTAYVETNQLIIDLNIFMNQEMEKLGYQSTLLPPTLNFDRKLLISGWSHRHVAYIAGLGTFGLNHLLITEKGCAGRLGSIVSDVEIEPTPRPTYEFCLNKFNGSCSLCTQRCPQGALSSDYLDSRKCYLIQQYNDWFYQNDDTALNCGKCSTGIPCAFMNPAGKILHKTITKPGI